MDTELNNDAERKRRAIFWDIKDIHNYESLYNSGIAHDEGGSKRYEIVKNLSYSTQYLEFINNTLKENIHSVVSTQLTKTFVIVGMGIVESILHYFINIEGLQKTTQYKEKGVLSNEKRIDEVFWRIETRMLEKVDQPINEKMDLNYMLKKARKGKMFGDDLSIYDTFDFLRKNRNRVHLQIVKGDLDHDFNNFRRDALNLMKESLKGILYSSKFNMNKIRKDEVLDFLKVED
ncbi:MAG: hypothetical protein ACJAWV_003290 [Flammeovirgaceae bacterium]|jgi:hypothetical protein